MKLNQPLLLMAARPLLKLNWSFAAAASFTSVME